MLNWLAQHKVSTHAIGALMTGLILLYQSNSEFHGLVTSVLAHLPKWALTVGSAAFWLYSWYRNGQKQNGNGAGSGPGNVLPIVKSGKGLVGGISNPLRIVAAVALLLIVCLPAAGQTPTPSPTPSAEPNEGVRFDVRTKFTRLLSGANATTIEGRLPISPRYSFLYSQTQIPSAGAQIYTGNIELREKLSHLVKSSSAQVNLDAIQVYVSGGMGTKRDDSGNNPTFAWNIVGGADLKIGQIGGGTLGVGFSVGYIGVPKERAGPKSFVLSSTAQIAPELTLKF